jgi:hypothetical protein
MTIRASVLVWLLLTVLTGVTWWVGVEHATGSTTPRADTLGLLVLAFYKARLIILHFMELRSAPLALRLAGDAWVMLTCLTVVLTYLLTAR